MTCNIYAGDVVIYSGDYTQAPLLDENNRVITNPEAYGSVIFPEVVQHSETVVRVVSSEQSIFVQGLGGNEINQSRKSIYQPSAYGIFSWDIWRK